MNQCWKKDKEMEAWRKGKGKGKGNDDGGKGWNQDGGKGWQQQHGKGKGKGKGQYNLSWDWGNNNNFQQASSKCWTLNLANKPMAPAINVAPPGLEGYFAAIRETDEGKDEKEYCEKFPEVNELHEVKNTGKMKMPRMPNYSKNMMRKKNGETKAEEKKKWKACYLFEKVKSEPKKEFKELNPFIASKPDAEGWVKVKGVMDSGASESVAPPEMCPHYEITPSPGSIAGQEYVSASDDTIPNLGEQTLDVVTVTGKNREVKYQIADVARPLNAVSEICDAGGPRGQHVVFGKYGGAVINLETGEQTPFAREDGIYCMEFWVRPKSSSAGGFPRQG